MDGDMVPNGRSAERSLHVSDTKTRDTPTIPSERNSMQARTQLMLYHRLLSGLIQSSPGLEHKTHHLDFDVFWLRIGVDPYEPFSEGFCEETGLSYDGATSRTPDKQGSSTDTGDRKRNQFCLNALADVWKESLSLLGIISVDPTLTLNYRQRATSGRKRRRHTSDGKGWTTSSQEEKELNQAIIASLAREEREDPALAYAIAESLRDAQATGDPIPGQASSEKRGSPSKRDAESDLDEPGVKSGNRTEGQEDQGPELIGSASFVMDEATLDARLEKVLEWWHGVRQPKGVELEDTGRCQCVLPIPDLLTTNAPTIVPASLALAVNGVRRRAMSSYQNYGREFEIHLNTEGMILICCESDNVLVYVKPK